VVVSLTLDRSDGCASSWSTNVALLRKRSRERQRELSRSVLDGDVQHDRVR
jgi:hypothetical protein